MPIVESVLAPLRDPRLAAKLADHATSPSPVWLWSTDGSRILWANAVGAAIFGAADAGECATRRFGAKDPAAVQIIRLAGSLPRPGQARLERLRGFGAGFGRALTCACSRLTLADGTAAVLVVATEPAGPPLTLRERVRRLFPDRERTLAAFVPEGTLLYATEPALTRFVGTATLSTLGMEAIAAPALAAGSASGATRFGPVIAERLGSDASTVLVLTFGAQPSEAQAGGSAPKPSAPAPAAAASPVEAPPLAPPATQAPATASPPAPPPARALAHETLVAERRHPLRFVWQMDADGRFVVGSDEFNELMGPRTTAAFGRLWSEIAAELKLDPENQIARAVATRETWSGITLSWPVDESRERMAVELSGLPVFDRNRNFRGYRGFGVCRDIARTNQLARARRERPNGFMAQPEAPPEGIGATAPTPQSAAEAETEAAPPSSPAAATTEPAAPAAASAPAVPASPEIVPRTERPAPDGTAAAAAANVVPFRPGTPTEPKPPSLSPVERKAFGELAQELTARLRGAQETSVAEIAPEGLAAEEQKTPAETAEGLPATTGPGVAPPAVSAAAEPVVASAPVIAPGLEEIHARAGEVGAQREAAEETQRQALPAFEPVLLDRIPVGVLIYRHDSLLYANRRFLEWSGYENLDALAADGGLNTLFAEPGAGALDASGAAQPLSIMTRGGDLFPVEGRLFTVPWSGGSALALVLTSGEVAERQRATAVALGAAENEIRELKAMLDAAADAAVVLDSDGRIVAATGGAEALFGRAASELHGRSLDELVAPESERAAREYFDRLTRNANALQRSMLHDALEVTARVRNGQLVPLSMTLTRIGGDRLCATFRDATAVKKIEQELQAAKREAHKAAAEKADFLAKVSHEIRTPLNAITGFAEVIMAERFGPISNERYREYLKDIHIAGTHLVSLLNDLLDLSKIETGQFDLTFANISLNDLTQQCVGLMQPQASRARIIIRTSLTPGLPQVVADERSLRQIVLNLLSNSIKFTGPGGQVIVSTALADSGETVLRVRDTGVGMSAKDVEAALEPFRQTATSGSWGSGGTGLGLPLTKALAEANRAHFSIKSAPNAGTLVEVAFPPTRAAAH